MEEKTNMKYDLIPMITWTDLNRIWRAKYIARSMVFGLVISLIELAISVLSAAFLQPYWLDRIAVILLIPLVVLAIYWTVYLNNKRFHDRWASWWWQLLMFIPIVNFFVTLYLWLAPWNDWENAYWIQAETKKREKVLAWVLPVLIFIVVIWILAAALLPRMHTAQNYEKDVTRKADLSHIESALVVTYSMKWEFPKKDDAVNWLAVSAIKDDLNYAGLDIVPVDPISSNKNSWLWTATSDWEYLYMVSKKNTIPNGWFVLMAKTDSTNSSNWVVCENGEGVIAWWTDLKDIKPCQSIVKWDSCSNYNWNCTYKDNSQLRYVLIW